MHIDRKQRLDRRLGWVLLLLLKPPARLLGRVLRRQHGSRAEGEIVFVKIVGGGSLLLAFPALLGARRTYPDLPMTLVCGRALVPFAEILGVFDRIEIVEDGGGLIALAWSSIRALGSLVRRRVDAVVDFEVYSVLSTVFSLLTLARNRIGFYLESTYWRRNVLTHLVFFNRASGVYHFYEAAVRLLGAAVASASDCREQILRRVAGTSVPAEIAGGPFVAVGAGCSEFGSVRMLPSREWRAFIAARRDSLGSMPWVFLGGEADRETAGVLATEIAAELGPSAFKSFNLCGDLSLGDSLGVISRARCFLGIDSALLHAARLMRIPSVSFWGPTDPRSRLAPIPGLEEEVHYRPPVCSPCLHVANEPPCKGNNVCMELFTANGPREVTWCENASGASVSPPAVPAS